MTASITSETFCFSNIHALLCHACSHPIFRLLGDPRPRKFISPVNETTGAEQPPGILAQSREARITHAFAEHK